MGSIAVSTLIVFVAFFLSLTMVYSAVMDSQGRLQRATEIHEEMLKNYYASSIEIIQANSTPLGLVIVILNDGKVVLNPSYISVIVDGVYAEILNYSVNGVKTTVWAPGEQAVLLVNHTGNFSRIKVVTEFGNIAYYTG